MDHKINKDLYTLLKFSIFFSPLPSRNAIDSCEVEHSGNPLYYSLNIFSSRTTILIYPTSVPRKIKIEQKKSVRQTSLYHRAIIRDRVCWGKTPVAISMPVTFIRDMYISAEIKARKMERATKKKKKGRKFRMC